MVRAHRFANVVRVGSVSGASLISRHHVSFSKNLSSSDLVLLDHLDGEDVIDFDVMSRDHVVEEVRGEHHVVSAEPELRSVLVVEEHDVAGTDHSELRDNEG